jgi:hypothetical protein
VWPCDDFLSAWSTRVPGARQPSESLLRGLALVEETRSGAKVRVYRYFPREKLATDVKVRYYLTHII